MDFFLEEAVVKKNRTFDEIIYYFSWLVIILCGAFAVVQLSSMTIAIRTGNWVVTLLSALLAGGMAGVIYIYHDQLRVEYEYTFTNGSLDFARVFNNKRRKSLGSLNVRTVEAFGPVTGNAFKRLSSMDGVRIDRWFLNREANLYFFFFQKEGSRRMIVLEPSEELVEMIRHFLSHGVYQE